MKDFKEEEEDVRFDATDRGLTITDKILTTDQLLCQQRNKQKQQSNPATRLVHKQETENT